MERDDMRENYWWGGYVHYHKSNNGFPSVCYVKTHPALKYYSIGSILLYNDLL